MIIKKSIVFSLTIISLLGIFLSTGFTREKKTKDTNLNKAKKIVEKYLEFEKKKEYQKLLNMYYTPPNYNQARMKEDRKAFIEALKIYGEELGDLIKYSYRNHERQDERKWTSGKIEPPALTLIYKVKYTKHTVDRTVTLIKENGKFKVGKFGIRGPLSAKIHLKIMEKLTKNKKQKK